MRNTIIASVILILCIATTADYVRSEGGIGNLNAPNKHNLSVYGLGPIRATSETEVCIFCHTPHVALLDGPLWNHSLSSATYTVSLPPGVTGTQLSTPENPPDGDSKLCLSCHDGTVSLGDVRNPGNASDIFTHTIPMGSALPDVGNGSSNLGTDISGHHLVSIQLNAELNAAKNAQCLDHSITFGVKGPLSITGPAKLKYTNNCYPQPECQKSSTNKGVQCTSCHDPHYDPIPGTTKFIRGAAAAPSSQTTYPPPTTWVFGDDICLSCHCYCADSGSCPQ